MVLLAICLARVWTQPDKKIKWKPKAIIKTVQPPFLWEVEHLLHSLGNALLVPVGPMSRLMFAFCFVPSVLGKSYMHVWRELPHLFRLFNQTSPPPRLAASSSSFSRGLLPIHRLYRYLRRQRVWF